MNGVPAIVIFEGGQSELLANVVAQIYAHLLQHPSRDPVGLAVYVELRYMTAPSCWGNGLNKEPRLRFTDEERADPALEKPIRKADKAAAKSRQGAGQNPQKAGPAKDGGPGDRQSDHQAGAGGQEEAALQIVPCGAGYPRQCRSGEAPQGNPGDRTGQCGRGKRPQVRGGCRDRR